MEANKYFYYYYYYYLLERYQKITITRKYFILLVGSIDEKTGGQKSDWTVIYLNKYRRRSEFTPWSIQYYPLCLVSILAVLTCLLVFLRPSSPAGGYRIKIGNILLIIIIHNNNHNNGWADLALVDWFSSVVALQLHQTQQ